MRGTCSFALFLLFTLSGDVLGIAQGISPEQLMQLIEISVPPNGQVWLNGELLGATDEEGTLSVAELPSGDYSVSVTHDGYETWIENRGIRGDTLTISANLRMTAEQREQDLQSAREQRQRAQALAQQAQSLFSDREYDTALEAAEESLRLEPGNAATRRLRDQIQQTLRILQ